MPDFSGGNLEPDFYAVNLRPNLNSKLSYGSNDWGQVPRSGPLEVDWSPNREMNRYRKVWCNDSDKLAGPQHPNSHFQYKCNKWRGAFEHLSERRYGDMPGASCILKRPPDWIIPFDKWYVMMPNESQGLDWPFVYDRNWLNTQLHTYPTNSQLRAMRNAGETG